MHRLTTISPLRWTKLILGLFCFGLGVAFMKRSELGLAPWEVLNDGLARNLGIMLGTASILIGLLVLIFWIPLRQRPDIGTVLNMLLVGAFTNLCLGILPSMEAFPGRIASLLVSIPLVGIGSTFYLGSKLGAGPRDGLMVGLHLQMGASLRMIRTVLEVAALSLGFLLGGAVGPGTVLFALTIGPVIHWMMEHFDQSVH